MTRQEVYQMIASVGLPTAYYEFKQATAKEPPFICYYYPGDDDFGADNINYVRVNQLIVELYTDNKDFELEDRLEAVFIQNDLFFDKVETYISDEKMLQVAYTMEVLINA